MDPPGRRPVSRRAVRFDVGDALFGASQQLPAEAGWAAAIRDA
jgi:hypothetical protein